METDDHFHSNRPIRIDVHLESQSLEQKRAEIRNGLLDTPRRLPTKYLYDDRGSALFELICELPEYYQTRTERGLLEAEADRIIGASQAEELVELGSGAATKTRALLSAMARQGTLRLYVPFDVSEGIVRRTAQELATEYPGLRVHGIVGDFINHLEHLPEGGRRLVIMLGGTIGNLPPDMAKGLLRNIAVEMTSGDFLLLGVDLIKDPARLEAAYNDSAGVTAEFNKNMLPVMNRMVRANFDPKAFDHLASYHEDRHRMEIRLRSSKNQTVSLPDLNLELSLREGEEILTEISTKYSRDSAGKLLSDGGFQCIDWYTDPAHLFGLALARKP